MKRAIFLSVIVASAAVFILVPKAGANETEECSLADIQGTYAYTLTGTITDGSNAGPLAAVGRLTFDGQGNIFGRDTISINGHVTRGRTYAGTYRVNPDCTYSTVILDSLGQEQIGDYVIVNHEELRAIRANETNVVTLNLKRVRRPRGGN